MDQPSTRSPRRVYVLEKYGLKRNFYAFAVLLLLVLTCTIRLDTKKPVVMLPSVWNFNVVEDSHEKDEIEAHRRRLKGYYGEWMEYMPEFMTAVKEIDKLENFPHYDHRTSAEKSEIRIMTKLYRVGEDLEAKITAKDNKNAQKLYGGDHFQSFLHYSLDKSETLNRPFRRGPAVENVVIPCHVTYNISSADYDVMCPLKVAGKFESRTSLIAPSEALYLIMLSTLNNMEENIYVNTTFINSKNETEYSQCAVGFDNISASQLCNYSNPTYGEPWYCIEPASKECNPIQSQRKVKLSEHEKRIGREYLDRLPPDGRDIRNSGLNVIVVGDAKKIGSIERDTSCSDVTTRAEETFTSGWLQDDNWLYSQCQNGLFNREKLLQCFANKTVFFIGDSVILRWFVFFQKTFLARELHKERHSWSQGRDATSTRYGVKLHYRSHGPPLYSEGPANFRPYITNTLDNMQDNNEKANIIVISIGEHFTRTHPDIFLQRIRAIKKAIAKLKLRLPSTKIFIKGMHTKSGFISDWVSYRLDTILKAEFAKQGEVVFLNMWTMSVVMGNQKTHPDDNVLFQQIGLFQSVVCS